jgi:hypothetical protein
MRFFLVTNFQSYNFMKKLYVTSKFIQLQFYLSPCICMMKKLYVTENVIEVTLCEIKLKKKLN